MRTRSFCLRLSISALCSSAWGQTAAVEGVVTNSLTGAPLPRVHVILKDPASSAGVQYGAQTSDDGKFSIGGINAGAWSFSCERVGFVMPRGASGSVNVVLKADDKTGDIQLKMIPAGAITGRVTDADGEPLERASVIAEGLTRKETTTDEKGQFRIGGLAPGKYRIKASRASRLYRTFIVQPEIRADGTKDVYDATTYYPGVLDARRAGKVEVRPGGESPGVDIQLTGVPFVRVSGKVVGMPRTAAEAYVTLSSRDIGGAGTPLQPDASFELWGLDPGKYRLSAAWAAPGGTETLSGSRMSTAPVEIEVAGSNIDNVELRAASESNISGRLLELDTQDGAQPVPQRAVILHDAVTGVTIGTPAPVGADDKFRLERIPPGKYVAGLSWQGAYVKYLRLGTAATDNAVLDLTNGSGGEDLTLLLSTAMGSVTGTVHDDRGEAVGGRVILAQSNNDALSAPRSVKAGPDGAYTFLNLPPGDYKALAVPEDDADLVLRDPGLEEYLDLMDGVEIHAGAESSMELKLRTEN